MVDVDELFRAVVRPDLGIREWAVTTKEEVSLTLAMASARIFLSTTRLNVTKPRLAWLAKL
jgi:hypothetical protein